MSGNLIIPHQFATATGLVPASQVDANFNAGKDYVNAREIALGAIGVRPSASVVGRFYYATDTAQLFVDTGSTWVQIGAPSGLGVGAIRGLTGVNNSGTPLTQYDWACDAVQLRNPIVGQTVVVANPGTRTNNILTAGPAVNGRDQAGVFSANSSIHAYYIYDGTTLATITSNNGPTVGPAALPGGYTHVQYIGSYRLNASTQLIPTLTRGAWIHHVGAQSVLSAGAQTVATAVSVAGFVPATALQYEIVDTGWAVTADGSGAISADIEIHVVSGTLYRYMARPALSGLAAGGSARTQVGLGMVLPYVGGQFFYRWVLTLGSAPSANISVSAYKVANGSE